MNPRSSKRNVPADPKIPQSTSVGQPWYKQVSDSLFHAAVSGSRCRPGTGREDTVPQPTCEQVKTKVSRNFKLSRSSVQQESLTSLPPPGMDAGLLWRKLMKEKQRSRNMQVNFCWDMFIIMIK